MTMELGRIPTPDLRRELARGMTLVAERLYSLGLIWVELERRGEDLSDLRSNMSKYLPLIGARVLAAEAVIAFAGRRSVLDMLQGVPLEEQRRLAAGGLIEVIAPDDPHETESVPIQSIPSPRLRLVFAEGKILSPAEQRVRQQQRRRPPRGEGEDRSRRYRPHYDRAAGTVTVGKMTVNLADLLAALAEATGRDTVLPDIPEEWVSVKTRLSREESQRLVDAARRAELPEWELIRKALRAFGLI